MVLDGRDLTGHSPGAIVRAGLTQVPEGRQVFPTLPVEANLLLGAYHLRDTAEQETRLARVHELFPILAERAAQRAGTIVKVA